ncbi:methyltransferase domain-containing protein [Umezawaea endophytica]|uniref:Class I SAM-dependent methyltransferase n=1 Tax=Umezawaea endophytica TaxID=1654476 RepID=A0A9X2VQR3_9PSEU|nr:class I SAM-dependent methyltransferase [Umezawaea endophytica]MCS7481105.1 class I SAM-dependent methyltransferase [Umezawaea endophytica]
MTTPPEDWARWRDQVDLGSYDDRWKRMAEAGQDPHGEAALVLAYAPTSVLDGGCGTGRVGIELARRGVRVVGVDVDADMITAARAKAPELRWEHVGLDVMDLGERFDVVVLAGNVIPYAAADVRAAVVATCAAHLEAGGGLVAGFGLRPGWPSLADYDAWCAAAGLEREDRWSTWDREPYTGGGYAVSVHRKH